MSKKKLFFLLIAITVFIVFLGVMSFYKTFYMSGISYKGIKFYDTLAFKNYSGGDQAANFLPDPQEEKEQPKFFEYVDNRVKNNFFHRYCSYFQLDIYYETEDYEKKKETLNQENHIDAMWDFYCLFEEIKNGEVKLIFCNDDEQIIRYLYLYGEIITPDTPVETLLMWNAHCEWQTRKTKNG